jgi:ABC-type transport system involved in multi-copper enzyme maturation permease subunit
MRILVIAGNTFRENVRDRILYNLILFALIMIFSSFLLGQLSLGHEDKVIVDLGLTSISVFGTLIAIFIGIGLVYKELEKRTVYALLAKPIRRGEFILGKYLGLLFTLAVNTVIMAAGLILTLLWHGGFGIHAFLSLLPAVYLVFLSLALTTALALLFSTFSTPALSALFTLFLWGIGHFNSDLYEFARLTNSGALKGLSRSLYYVLPNFGNFTSAGSRNVIQSAAYHHSIGVAVTGWITAYTVLYCAALLGISIVVFARRDFK